MSPLLVVTHLIAFALGSGLTYYAVTRLLDSREVDGHPVIELHHTEGEQMSQGRSPNWLGVVILVASALVIGIGVQAWMVQRDDAAQDRADRAYANCLTDFAADLVDTLKKRTDATTRVTEAEARRDAAVDEVLDVVDRGRQVPPKATEEDFDRALRRAVVARQQLDVVQKKADKVREDNQYVPPQAVCSR